MLGACASGVKDQMKAYREAYAANNLDKAAEILNESDLKKDEKSKLLWLLENGTLSLSQGDETKAISHFQNAVELIDQLYTKKISAKAASFLINDASDVFYGASYERSYAHYFLSRAYYARYLKTKEKLDLQGARGTILAWDSYFAELGRSAAPKTVYRTDFMLKVFGGEIHEVSEIRNDKQIALQLYKDALDILESMGGAFAVFNTKNVDYLKEVEQAFSEGKKVSSKAYASTPAKEDFRNFLIYKILSLTKEIRGTEFKQMVKSLNPSAEILAKVNGPKANLVIVLEEGLIPAKVGKPFNFGIKGAMESVEGDSAKQFIATVGVEVLTVFAMNKLGMTPQNMSSTGGFVFAHDLTRFAVQEAAVSFELPMIEDAPKPSDLDVIILDEKGAVIKQEPLAVISENGEIAKVVLEEDVVSRYVKTGTRVATRHILAIIAAMGVFQKLKSSDEFIASAAAMMTYVGASKGIAALEKADTRHWTTLPKTMRMSELALKPGTYEVALLNRGTSATDGTKKILGKVVVNDSGKLIQHFKLVTP